MANTYYTLLAHIVFAVKNRDALIPTIHLPRLHQYIGGLIRRHDTRCRPLAVGGVNDHVHILLTYSPAVSISKLVQDIKVASNAFINDTMAYRGRFGWQKGFACISVSPRDTQAVTNYIAHQIEHHKGRSLEEEIIAMLRKAGIEFDEDHILEGFL